MVVTKRIINDSSITQGIKAFDDVFSCILAIALMLDEKLLLAKFCYDITGLLFDRNGQPFTDVRANIVMDYLEITGLPMDFHSRLQKLLDNK